MAALPQKPPLHAVTDDDRGALIVIVAYTWVFLTLLAAAIRFATAWKHGLRLKIDDAAFAISAHLAISSSVAYHIASNNGLGMRLGKVSPKELDKYFIQMYAGEILGLFAQWLAKVSFLSLCERVAPRKPKHYWIVFGMIHFWGVFAVLAIALQCGLPKPWIFRPETCATRGMMYYPVVIMNIITDVILGTWLLPTLWHLLMDADRRLLVIILFGSRLIVPLIALLQLISVAKHMLKPDYTYESFGRVVWSLCVTHLSVLQSTIPRTKRFIAALQLRAHATVRLTNFELRLPTEPTTLHSKPSKKDLDISGNSGGSSQSTTVRPKKAHTRPRSPSIKRSASQRRSASLSPTRTVRSEHPLMPLQLTPSADQYFTTEISSQADPNLPKEAKRASKRISKRFSKRHDGNDWRKYLRRSKTSADMDMSLSSMFSRTSRNSFGRERIMQTKEVTQKVEIMSPKESRWTFRRQSEGSKRFSLGLVEGDKRDSQRLDEGSKAQSLGPL